LEVLFLRSLKEAPIEKKRILMRVDFNVPVDKNGNIIDDTKIRAAIPTIEYILAQKGQLILMSHFGRPKGEPVEKYSLKKIAEHLNSLIEAEVIMAPDCIGPEIERMVENMNPGQVLLLENVRFHPGEEENDPEFTRKLASVGDIFVNDAFGSAHRAHSSTAGLADYLPAYAGFLLEKEVYMLKKVLENPERPRLAILGGAKIKDKLGLIEHLLNKMDSILIGGGMANTFLLAQGTSIGRSICEEKQVPEAQKLLQRAREMKVQLLLPVDVVVAEEIASNARASIVEADQIPENLMIVDIGPKTIQAFAGAIAKAKTVVWNGPLGVFEIDQFAEGTKQVALALAQSQAISVVGGGESVAAVRKFGVEKHITHISTGGGATLEFLEGIALPGVRACDRVLQY
jgi:phosphoglycerate kinase